MASMSETAAKENTMEEALVLQKLSRKSKDQVTNNVLLVKVASTNHGFVLKREKAMSKFKGRKGRFDTLPQWIENFENDIRV